MKLMDVQLPRYFIYQSVYTPTLTYGHKFWVIPPPQKRKRLWTPIVQMSFLQRVAGFSHGERSFHIHIETTQMKLFWDLKGCLLGEGITGMSYC